MQKTHHLDIGCGSKPRNPFCRDELHGVDIIEQNDVNFNYKQCNVVLDPLPYGDSSFDSVSAYDFIEHIPRFAIIHDTAKFPFIQFMNEVYRVLKPNGLFYAITPAYPRKEAFVDPTHINIISNKTHTYFTSPKYTARMYGFEGEFEVIRLKWIKPAQETRKERPWYVKLLKNVLYEIYFTKKSHLLWEFRALKSE
jgi:SAM-dependent methyltransferase